jgi:hypothetical protein
MSKPAHDETIHARHGIDFASTFEAATAGAFRAFTVGVTAPEASTGGGTRARQHIVLTAREGRIFVVGSANATTKTAELRTLGFVCASAEKRFGTGRTFSPEEYVAFIEKATRVLEGLGFAINVIAFEKTPSEPPPAPVAQPRTALFVTCALMAACSACSACWMVLHW